MRRGQSSLEEIDMELEATRTVAVLRRVSLPEFLATVMSVLRKAAQRWLALEVIPKRILLKLAVKACRLGSSAALIWRSNRHGQSYSCGGRNCR